MVDMIKVLTGGVRGCEHPPYCPKPAAFLAGKIDLAGKMDVS